MPNEQALHVSSLCEAVFKGLYEHPRFLQQAAIDDFIEKNEDVLNANDLLAPPKGMQYAGEHFYNSRDQRQSTSRLYLPVAPQLLPEFRSLLQNRDYLEKQSRDVWMYFKICQQHAGSDLDLCRLLPEGTHNISLDYSDLVDFNGECAVTDEKAEALKVQYATYYEAILCRLADNLFLEAV